MLKLMSKKIANKPTIGQRESYELDISSENLEKEDALTDYKRTFEDDVYNTGNLFDSYDRLANALEDKVNDFVKCFNEKSLISFDRDYIAEKVSITCSECTRRIPIFDEVISNNLTAQGKVAEERSTIERKAVKTKGDFEMLQCIETKKEELDNILITFDSFKDFAKDTLARYRDETVNPNIFKPLQSVIPNLRGHAEMVNCLNSIEDLLRNNKLTISSAATKLEGIAHTYNSCLKEQKKKIELSVKSLLNDCSANKKISVPQTCSLKNKFKEPHLPAKKHINR